MANPMAQNASHQSARIPIVARACLNFLKRRQMQQQAAFAAAPKPANENTAPIGQVNLPVLLGSKVQFVEPQKHRDACEVSPPANSPSGTPTSVGASVLDRTVSFRSNASSNASTAYSVKNTFIHVEDSSDSESYREMKRSASEPHLYEFQSCTTRPRAESSSSVQSLAIGSQVSIGSVDHKNGNCRPCAWFWKGLGCKNGSQCRHCHLCPQNEIQQRKKNHKKLADEKKKKQKHNAMLLLLQDANAHQDFMSSSDVVVS